MSKQNENKDPPEQAPPIAIPPEWATWLGQNWLLIAILLLLIVLIAVVVWRTRRHSSPRRFLYYG